METLSLRSHVLHGTRCGTLGTSCSLSVCPVLGHKQTEQPELVTNSARNSRRGLSLGGPGVKCPVSSRPPGLMIADIPSSSFSVLGAEPRALYLLGTLSTTAFLRLSTYALGKAPGHRTANIIYTSHPEHICCHPVPNLMVIWAKKT